MSIVLIIYSLVVGRYALALLRTSGSARTTTDILLSFVLGLGITAQISFLLIILCNGFVLSYFLLGLALFLAGLALWAMRKDRNHNTTWIKGPALGPFFLLVLPFIMAFLWVLNNNPNGGWDAWALWNLRANILFRGADQWTVFNEHWIQNKHPFMQSYLILAGWAMDGKEGPCVPIMLAFCMTIVLLLTLYAALHAFTRSRWSLLGAALLILTPVFLHHASSQYADLALALFLLTILVQIMFFLDGYHADALLIGALTGILTFVKNEGLMASGIITVLLVIHFIRHKNGGDLKQFLAGALVFSIPAVLHAAMLHPAHSAGLHAIAFSNIFNLEQWKTVLEYWGYVLWWSGYCGGVPFFIPIAWGLFWGANERSKGWSFLGRFLLFYFFALVCVHVLLTKELLWHLWTTVWRFSFQIIPVFILFLLYGLFHSRLWNPPGDKTV